MQPHQPEVWVDDRGVLHRRNHYGNAENQENSPPVTLERVLKLKDLLTLHILDPFSVKFTRWNGGPLSWLQISLLIRVYSVLLIRTQFAPDETYQSTEIAYKMAFGVGHSTWEWDDCYRLRGYLHVLPFYVFYLVLKFLRLDYPLIVAYGPRLVQAIAFASVTDHYVLQVYRRVFFNKQKGFSLCCCVYFCSWFYFYTLTRTYSSCCELCFMVLGVWLCEKREANIALGIGLCGGLSCVLRPTAGIFWITYALLILKNSKERSVLLPSAVLLAILTAGLFGILLDSLFYGRFTVVAWNFFRFNFLEDGGKAYGSHPFHWYCTEGVAVVLLSYFPMFLYGCVVCAGLDPDLSDSVSQTYSQEQQEDASAAEVMMPSSGNAAPSTEGTNGFKPGLRSRFGKANEPSSSSSDPPPAVGCTEDRPDDVSRRPLVIATVVSILFLSLVSHKEHRLLIPHAWVAFPFVAIGLERWRDNLETTSKKGYALLAIFMPQLLAALFFAVAHQRGGDSVLASLRSELKTSRVFFLTPCHSMPLWSYLHGSGVQSAGFLDCSPRQQLSWRKRFEREPVGTLETLFLPEKNRRRWTPAKDFCSSGVAEDSEQIVTAKGWAQVSDSVYSFALPDYFVVHSPALDRSAALGEWLAEQKYTAKKVFFDALFGDSFDFQEGFGEGKEVGFSPMHYVLFGRGE